MIFVSIVTECKLLSSNKNSVVTQPLAVAEGIQNYRLEPESSLILKCPNPLD